MDAYQDPEIQRWHVRRADSAAEAAEWIAAWQAGWAAESEAHWAVVDAATDTLLGRAALKALNLADGSAEVAYWTAPAARGSGVAPRAVEAMASWAFETGFRRLVLEHAVANEASCRVAGKTGFAPEGVHRSAWLQADGRHDVHTHARLRDTGSASSPVTADDVDLAVRLAVGVLRGAPAERWGVKAGSLEWDCWETVEHLANDLYYYAVQLGPQCPPLDTHVPFALRRNRPEGPVVFAHADRDAGPAGLVQVLEACGALLVAMVRTTPPRVRAHHAAGVSDPEGFAALGVQETLVHLHDVAEGFGLAWTPPAALCSRVLARLFPEAPGGADPWLTLLWATGRAELPGHPRLTTWRSDSTPRS